MKEARILRLLGNVDDAYITEAAPDQAGRRPRLGRRLLLLAACLCLLLVLSAAAYAANWFGLRELLFPAAGTAPAQESGSAISLAGYQGSPEWLAQAEWQAFLRAYDPDGARFENIQRQLDSSLARYSCYLVYSREMADRMEEIAAKYALKLHTTVFDLGEHPELLAPLGDFLGGLGGYYTHMYEDGTFQVEGTVEFPDIGAWDFTLLRAVRGTLHDAMLDIGDPAEYQEAVFQTACGVSVAVALSPTQALIFAPLSDSLVTVYLPYGSAHGLTHAHLEALADRIDFSALTPAVPPSTQSGLTAVQPDAQTRAVFAAVLRSLLYSKLLPDGTKAEMPASDASRFTIADVDGDGKEELVLLYDPGVTAGAAGYIVGYDAERQNTYVQLEEFPAFIFLDNGNLKALASHNQTLGALWPYFLYRYCPENDSYRQIGHVHAEDRSGFEANGTAEQYPAQADVSGTGTVYYIGTDGWGTAPVDQSDYLAWLEENQGAAGERALDYLPVTEEHIRSIGQRDG